MISPAHATTTLLAALSGVWHLIEARSLEQVIWGTLSVLLAVLLVFVRPETNSQTPDEEADW